VKPAKLVKECKLEALPGVKDVSFGAADPVRRQDRDFSKDGIKANDPTQYDDHKARMKRWSLI
jgi:hypothetical protein